MILGKNRSIVVVLAFVAAVSVLESCSSKLGWGVVLWTSSDGKIPSGTVVPIYIKSNIQKLYVVGVPGGREKAELPLWQVEFFKTRRAAQARAESLGEYTSLYMAAARDGIPIRDAPSNSNGTQVFRLREGQSVKILAKVEGEAVMTGGQVLPGDWFQVLADDGTRGYAYSYAFKIYDETKEGPPVVVASKKSLSGRVDLIFSKSWRPEYFQRMLDDERIDLDLFSMRYGLFVDAIHKQLRLELPGASKLFNYSSISESDGVYSFGGTPLKIKIESERKILLSWVDEIPGAGDDASSAQSGDSSQIPPVLDDAMAYRTAGADGRAVLVALDVEPRETIRLEELRRQKLLESFVDAGAAWSSPEAGSFTVAKNRRFSWTGRSALPDGFLPAGVGEYGEAAFRLFLGEELKDEWDGAFSLRFDAPSSAEPGAPRPGWLDFVYRLTPEGLVLAPASQGGANLIVVGVEASVEPIILRRSAS
jgi:hypothetical protein